MNEATISIEGSQHLYPTDKGGRFWIYLSPGKYRVSISCPGFKTHKQVNDFIYLQQFLIYGTIMYSFGNCF